MGLENIDFSELREAVKSAVGIEAPNVEKIRQKVQDFEVIPLEPRQCHSVAPVAMDGGENRISFDPVHIEILRVVDSEDEVHVQEIIPLSEGIGYIEKRFNEVPVLKRLQERLGLKYGKELSYLLPAEGGGTTEEKEHDLRSFLQVYRDVIEWAVLLDMAWRPTIGKTLLIRDSLLRTKYFRYSGEIEKSAFGRLRKSFKNSHDEKGTFLVGVAKQSKILTYLSLALTLEGTLRKPYPCFIEIPKEVEKEAYTFAKTWMEGPSFGTLHLVKLNPDPGGVIYPVEIPEWLMGRRKEVLECLLGCSDRSFPVPGYPYPLVQAHENAVLKDLEMSVLTDIVLNEFTNLFDKKDAERLWSHVTIGRGLYLKGVKR